MRFPRPFALLVLVAALCAACTGSTSGSPSTGSSLGSGTAGPSSSCSSTDLDTATYPEDLAGELTSALQSHDGRAFEALGTTSQAHSGLSRWWTNNDALGFTTGSVSVPDLAGVTGNTVTLAVGVHSSLDPDDTEHHPMIAGAEYKVSVALGGTGCKQVQITSWTPIEDAPWDSVPKLYVHKTTQVVVAGAPSLKKQIDRVARLGDRAATWDRTILRQAGHGGYVTQKGFVVFVAGSAKDAETWFRPANAKKPTGWTADAGDIAGFEFPMHGAPTPPGVKVKQQVSGLPTGDSRVVITPAGAHDKDKALEGTLVHEFVHDIFRVDDIWSWGGGGDPVEAATAEGAARWFEAMYDSHPATPTKKSKINSLLVLQPVVQSRHFSGAMPTNGQVYGAAKDANYYYDLSATGYSYLASAYGIRFAFQCIHDAYLQGGGPFAGVVESIKNGTITYEAQSAVQARWASWVRGGFRKPAPR